MEISVKKIAPTTPIWEVQLKLTNESYILLRKIAGMDKTIPEFLRKVGRISSVEETDLCLLLKELFVRLPRD